MYVCMYVCIYVCMYVCVCVCSTVNKFTIKLNPPWNLSSFKKINLYI